jgi:superfamily I DNA and/or RNA helicase
MVSLFFVLNSAGCEEMRGRSNNKFDVVIIDEAAQATESACWVALLKGKKSNLVCIYL